MKILFIILNIPEAVKTSESASSFSSSSSSEKVSDGSEDSLKKQDLFVVNLGKDVTSDELKEYFTKACGELELAEVRKRLRTIAYSSTFNFKAMFNFYVVKFLCSLVLEWFVLTVYFLVQK